MKISTLGIKNSTVHIHAAAAHRMTGFIFDHVQFAGIHCKLVGTFILTGLSFLNNFKMAAPLIRVLDGIFGVGVVDEGDALDFSASPTRSPLGKAIEGASTRKPYYLGATFMGSRRFRILDQRSWSSVSEVSRKPLSSPRRRE